MRLTLLLLLINTLSFGRVCNSVQNGNWAQSSTWDCTGTPADNDTVIISTSDTVSVTTNIGGNNTYMLIQVDGVLCFNGGKIRLNDSSYVYVNDGGRVVSKDGCNCDQISIGNNQTWQGSDGDLNGPECVGNNCSSLGVTYNSRGVVKDIESNNILYNLIYNSEGVLIDKVENINYKKLDKGIYIIKQIYNDHVDSFVIYLTHNKI